jgi:hypothetical protein
MLELAIGGNVALVRLYTDKEIYYFGPKQVDKVEGDDVLTKIYLRSGSVIVIELPVIVKKEIQNARES